MEFMIEATQILIIDSTESEYLQDDMSGALADVTACCTCSCSCCC